jgi:NADPH:quinone reductase
MKAIVISSFGGPEVLSLREVEEPEPSRLELRVKVHATALNRADLLQRRGHYPPPPGVRPDIPGLEYAGVVDSLGAGVSRFRKGDRVMGLLPGGGYAEKIVTPEGMTVPVPPNLSLEEAAALPEVFMTAYDALFVRVRLAIGETLLIHAAGSGVGTAALQLAKAAGCRVLGTAGSREKLKKAAELGLDLPINYRESDFVQVVQEQVGGVNAILDLVGGDYLSGNLKALAQGGRLVVVGLLRGARAETDLGAIVRKRLTIVGTVLRSRPIDEKMALCRQFERHLLPLLAQGRLRPVIDRVFPWQQAAEAHRRMEENRNFGKIVLSLASG